MNQNSNPQEPQEAVAIIGMAGRFPKAKNLDEFWRNLRDGVECVSFFQDEDALQWLPIEHKPDPKDPRYVRARAVLEKPEWFDAAFFGMNPQEAKVMDPQHRVFLECAWEALENAGVNPEGFPGLIGVFAGASMNTYLFTNLLTNRNLIADQGVFSTMIANCSDFVPTRTSYKLNLRGPSVNVQTACSTSLVAVCMAAQNLLSYRCDVALAGGVSITFPANRGQFHLEGGILSNDGHCRAFDAKALGTVLGDGCGIVVLKRLSEAIEDGDNIQAVIKGTAINNDGSVKIGYTAPSIDGQAEAIAMAHSEAGFDPKSVSYIEAHGTGTPLGDPIEIAGLTKAFGLDGSRGQFCAVGSVKSNIGHLDIGAGVAGLIKTVLALQHEQIPPSLHFETPNPKIDFKNSPFFVNAQLRAWKRNGAPRRAGVSSFGIGGTNAHAALEEAPALEPTSPAQGPQLLLVSARTATALDAATENLATHLQAHAKVNLADVAYTLQVGRKTFAHRRAIVANDVTDAIHALQTKEPKQIATGHSEAEGASVAFMFPGQGAQAINMARELYESDAAFRANVDRSCALLQPKLGLDLREILFPVARAACPRSENEHGQADRATAERATKLLNETRITQPALFVIEHALAQRWIGWGLKPAAMIGHSLGEYVAATLAGVFSLEDALTLVAERARLMQAQAPGAMLAVRKPEADVRGFLNHNLALAAVNAPGLCVVSGPFDEIEALEKKLSASAIASKRLTTSHAFHSAMMEPALAPLADVIRRLKLNAPKIPFVSNLTGTWITAAEATSADYWTQHLRNTVRFADGVATLVAGGSRVLLEVGPGSTLGGLARQHPSIGGGAATVVCSLGRAKDGVSDRAAVLLALGELWIGGANVAWRDALHANARRRIVPLPTYPFERKRYLIEPGTAIEMGPVATSHANGAATVAAVDEAAVPAANGQGTLATVRKLFEELSGMDLAAASADESFYQLGFDSLFLTQASLAVGRKFGLEITFRQLREQFTTLGKLAEHIDGGVGPALAAGPSRLTQPKTESTSSPESVTACRQAAALQPNQDKTIPLTDPQREMWFATQLGTAVSSAYNEESTLRLDGRLDVAALHRALKKLVARHEALRTTFSPNGDVQRIAATADIELPLHDLSTVDAALRPARVNEFVDLHVQRAFDLVHGPLFRAALLRVEPERHLLMLVVHHIICDGWSLGILVRELGELYAAEVAGRSAALPPALAFTEYAARHAAARQSPEYTAAERFWKQQFASTVPVLELPTDRPRPAVRTYAGGYLQLAFSPELTAALKKLCAEKDCTLFTALFASFNVLLHRLSGQDDLVVGVPSAAQVMDGAGNLVGHFANLLPVRSTLPDGRRFDEYLATFRGQMADALEHWRYPFSTLVHELKLARDASRMPLANVVFNSSRLRGALRFGELGVEPQTSPKRFVNFDLNFNCALTDDDKIALGCYYSTELFDEATVARWIRHFETLLHAVAAQPDAPVAALPLLTAPERRELIEEWNATAADYPREACVHERFFALAQQSPNATALVFDGAQMTYGELARRATELAARLQALGVGPDVPVGICMHRSFDMVIAVLAVLKAGGVYVPLDPAYPADRLAFMLEDSRAPVLLTQRAERDAVRLERPGLTVIVVDDPALASRSAVRDIAQPKVALTPDHLAYLIYTSGSTGKPKGVAMPHRPLTNLITWQLATARVGKGARTLQFASLSFDVSFQEIFSTLSAGGTLVLVDEMRRRDMRELWRLMARERIERLFLPFVALQQLAETFKPAEADDIALREVITAGEPLQVTPKLVTMFTRLSDCTLENQYGPSESHVVTAYRLSGAPRHWPARPSIGRPIANTEIYLLDRQQQPVPIGVPGELCIGGDCLARGYLNRPELTAEKFTALPFRGGERVYRTGDLARYRADGTIEFLGRIDHQVKLNGYRIELGEIESVLRQHAAVQECAVIVREDEPGNRRLVGYFVPSGGEVPGLRELRQHLQQRLPDYMVPAAFVVLEKIPVTPSGKADRRALPAPEATPGESASTGPAPRTTAEELVAEIWRHVLGVKQVGVHANFFELGGHSLLATQVLTRMQESLGVELPLARFFSAPTIAELAAVTEEMLIDDIKSTAVEDTRNGAAAPALATAKE